MTEESMLLNTKPQPEQQPTAPSAPYIKQEIAPNTDSTKSSTHEEDDIDTMPFDELQQLYHTLQDRFKTVSSELSKTYEEEQNQRKTLSYYQRRNQAILNVLECFENTSTLTTTNNNTTSTPLDTFDADRIRRIVAKVPRLAKTLSPLMQQHQQQEASPSNIPISSNLLLNAYLIENVPDLIDDDLTSIEINPQSIESWCRRNQHTIGTSLVTGASKPVTIKMLKRLNEYSGVEFDLGVDGKLVVTPQAASSSSKKRRIK